MIDLLSVVALLVAFIVGVTIFWGIFLLVLAVMMKLFEKTRLFRRLLPNPALSGRCIEDFYPLVYFLGLCKGLSYLLYKNMFGKHPHRKNAPHSPYGKKDAQR
jgi:hypothetical protein